MKYDELKPFRDSQLSSHFIVDEFVKTTHLQFLDENISDLLSHPIYISNLVKFCDEVLEPLRTWATCPIIITSGYRCDSLNEHVYGSPTSFHKLGCACDFHFKHEYNKPNGFFGSVSFTLDALINKLKSLGAFEIGIYRHKVDGVQWIHVAFNPFIKVCTCKVFTKWLPN